MVVELGLVIDLIAKIAVCLEIGAVTAARKQLHEFHTR